MEQKNTDVKVPLISKIAYGMGDVGCNFSWIFRSLSRLNYMFLLVMFLCFFIVFLNKDILYNVYIFPFYLILIGMYLGFIITRIFILKLS